MAWKMAETSMLSMCVVDSFIFQLSIIYLFSRIFCSFMYLRWMFELSITDVQQT